MGPIPLDLLLDPAGQGIPTCLGNDSYLAAPEFCLSAHAKASHLKFFACVRAHLFALTFSCPNGIALAYVEKVLPYALANYKRWVYLLGTKPQAFPQCMACPYPVPRYAPLKWYHFHHAMLRVFDTSVLALARKGV